MRLVGGSSGSKWSCRIGIVVESPQYDGIHAAGRKIGRQIVCEMDLVTLNTAAPNMKSYLMQ